MDKIKRNEFLKELGFKGSALFALYCSGISCLPAPDPNGIAPIDTSNSSEGQLSIDLSKSANKNLLNNGGYLVSGSIVIANNNGSYIAATQICSHENKRRIIFRNEEWYCTDHGARFNLSGKGLNKDASKGLKVYTVSQNGNVLTIS